MSQAKPTKNETKGQSGQVIVEYILLLVFSLTIGVLVTKLFVNRAEGKEGFVILQWQALIQAVAADVPDRVK